MFLSREIDIKLCQIYTKIHIYAILYKSCNIKQIIFNKRNQSENDDIPQKPENLRFAPVIIIIDNIITYYFLLHIFILYFGQIYLLYSLLYIFCRQIYILLNILWKQILKLVQIQNKVRDSSFIISWGATIFSLQDYT